MSAQTASVNRVLKPQSRAILGLMRLDFLSVTASAVAAGTAATTMGLGASVMAGTAISAGTGYIMAAAAVGHCHGYAK